MIENITLSDLQKNQDLNKYFYKANLNEINQTCTFFKGNFYLDSFNYYPITESFKSFDELFLRVDKNSLAHYHSEHFYKNLKSKMNDLKVFRDVCVIGSNAGNNYFSNLIHFFI